MKSFLTAAFFLILISCGGNEPGNTGGNDPTGGSNATVTQLTNSITTGGTAKAVVDATIGALEAGGVRVGEIDARAKLPAASWYVDTALAFNMASEARARATSGRFTVTDLAQMWKDFGFPFQGAGTPGEQLLAFLRGWTKDAKTKPGDANSFTPLFIESMVAKQVPSVNLTDPNITPDAVRLSLLEIELMIAAFDRAYQPTNAQAVSLAPRAVGRDYCTEFKALFGKIGGKVLDKALGYVKGTITDTALAGLGLTNAEMAVFNETHKNILKSLSVGLKIVKVVQLYSSSSVALNVEGANPTHRPHKNQARKLVPVVAIAGVPEQDWQDYQNKLGSSEQQTMLGCLGILGVPLPPDLKQVAANSAKWKVYWQLVKGSPTHVVIPSDVNNFDAPSAGDPYGMKLVSNSSSTSKATLKVDLNDEPELASIFDGPVKKADVTVKASVDTSEVPNPAMLVQLGGLVGAIPTLVDLSAGWLQKALPPSNTITFQVEYHPMPDQFEAKLNFTMTHKGHLRGEPAAMQYQTTGSWLATMNRKSATLPGGMEVEYFDGVGAFQYAAANAKKINQAADDKCTYTFQTEPVNGEFKGTLGPASTITGQLVPAEGYKFNIGTSQGTEPKENTTLTTVCPGPNNTKVTTVVNFVTRDNIEAIDAINLLEDTSFFADGGTIPGLHPSRWNKQADGSLEQTYTQAKTVSVVASSAAVLEIDVISQNTVVKLKPIFAPTQP
jgi:hypothetical protein